MRKVWVLAQWGRRRWWWFVEWARVFLPELLKNDYSLEAARSNSLETFPSDRPSIEQVLDSIEQNNGINVKHNLGH